MNIAEGKGKGASIKTNSFAGGGLWSDLIEVMRQEIDFPGSTVTHGAA